MSGDAKARIALVEKAQGVTFGTETFVGLLGRQSTTCRQRLFSGETALLGGLAKPAVPATFGPLDVCVTGVVNLVSFYSRIEMKHVVRLVRSHWRELALAIA